MFNIDEVYQRCVPGPLIDFKDFALREQLLDRDEAPQRFLFVVESEINQIRGWPKNVSEAMVAEMLDFLLGEPVTWGDPEDGNCMKPLNARAGWLEFKVRTDPHARFFGAFVDRETLVCVRSRLRKDVPADNETQLSAVWDDIWGAGNMARLDCSDPYRLIENLRSVRP